MKAQIGLVLVTLIAICRSQQRVIPGGIEVIIPTPTIHDPIVLTALELQNAFNQEQNPTSIPLKVVNVDRVTRQIVSGVKYVVTYVVDPVTDDGRLQQTCVVSYVSQPWLNPPANLAGRIFCNLI